MKFNGIYKRFGRFEIRLIYSLNTGDLYYGVFGMYNDHDPQCIGGNFKTFKDAKEYVDSLRNGVIPDVRK